MLEQYKHMLLRISSSLFGQFDGNMTKNHRTVASSASIRELLNELSVKQKELREIKKKLDRFDDNRAGNFLEQMEESQLMYVQGARLDVTAKGPDPTLTAVDYRRDEIFYFRVQYSKCEALLKFQKAKISKGLLVNGGGKRLNHPKIWKRSKRE